MLLQSQIGDWMMASDKDTQEILQLQRDVHEALRYERGEDIQAILSGKSPEVIRQVLNEPYLGAPPLVVAAQLGYIQVVKLLVDHFKVDLDLEGGSIFGYKKRTSSIIFAASHRNWEIVRFLVDKGCDVNIHGPSGQTAVSYAYKDGDITMMEYLLERGAKIEWVNSKGQTCVIVAHRDENEEMVGYLFEKNADPNEKNEGDKVGHHVSRELVQRFLMHGSEFARSTDKFSNVILAALEGHSNAVDFFLSSPTVCQQDKIDGLEVQAAMLCARDINVSFRYLERAMRERYRDPSNVISKPLSPLPALINVAESQTMEELRARKDDHDTLRLECLAILLRVVGPWSRFVRDLFVNVCDILCKNGHSHESTAVLLQFLKVYTSRCPFLSQEQSLVCDAFEMIRQQGLSPSLVHIIEILGLMIEEMKRQEKQMDPANEGETFSLVSKFLKYVFFALSVVRDDDKESLQKLVESLIHLNPSLPSGRSILQFAATPGWVERFNRRASSTDVPYGALIAFLIECGADANAMDKDGARPLHVTAMWTREDETDVACDVVRVLLEAGALVGVKDGEGYTPLDYAKTEAVADLLREHLPPTLQTLAAMAVLQHNLPYAAQLPEIVADFVRLHSPEKK